MHDENAAAFQVFCVSFPAIPQTSQHKHIIVTHADVMWGLVAIDDIPLLEAIHRIEAASMLVCGAIGRLPGYLISQADDM